MTNQNFEKKNSDIDISTIAAVATACVLLVLSAVTAYSIKMPLHHHHHHHYRRRRRRRP